MPILNFNIASIGQSGQIPTFIYLQTNDPYSVVSSAGYLNKFVAEGNVISANEMALVTTSSTPNGTPSVNLFKVTFSGGNWTLVANNPPTPSGGGFTWNAVTTSTTLVPGNAYVNVNNASQISYSLPVTANFGDTYLVSGFFSGNWQIVPGVLQFLLLGANKIGTGQTYTTLTSSNGVGNLGTASAIIVCVETNTTFLIYAASGSLNPS